MRQAISDGGNFLFCRDPAVADCPAESKVGPNWFKLGFPSGYVADMLQNLEVLADLGHAKDSRLAHAWVPVERNRSASKWVTLRACRVLKAALG